MAVRETSENVGVRSSEPRWTVCTRSVSDPVSRVSRVYRPAQIHGLASGSLSEVICKYVDIQMGAIREYRHKTNDLILCEEDANE